ncbi:hypothetical protein KIN20_003425 [Parelaphostrongylus tenuis]|uniref:Uncharacterized protein n=1 Tax=Parelaphostrongylus tenuis TaxID=148309 RepID=A0AAD5MPW8_PARTN|nr:hypothetical protein KIN20_003425 [Parelaphostrongylus tenuis]
MCKTGDVEVTIMAISTNHTSISGILMTRNIIMANWSSSMWQSVMNRAIRLLASGPFASHFFSAAGIIN